MPGTIDNLNFEIILKDEEFGRKVQENIKLAKDLNTSLSSLLDLQSKVKGVNIKTPNATQQVVNEQKIAAATAKRVAAEEALSAAKKRTKTAEENLAAATARRITAEQRAIAATARSVNAQTSLKRSIKGTTSAAYAQASVLGELKGLALQYLSIKGVASFVSSLVRVTGEFELQKTTMAAMLGDMSKAQQIMTDIKGLAVESPFQFKELATYAKQLTAFAVPAEKLFETTKMLADVSAGLGVGMDRIVLAYGQVKSAAFLRGQEVRQFTEAGIPILNMLAKQFEELEGDAVSVGEVFDRISARMVSFEMVNKVFKDLTSEGGKFYQMQEVQAETLRGKISNLKDAYEMMLNEMGSQKSGFLKGSVDMLRGLMTHWEAVGKAIGAVVVALGVYKTTLAIVAVAEKIAATKQLIHKWQLLNSVLKGMGKNVSRMKTAWTVFGSSAKVALGGVAAAAGALLTIIISNISKIGELKRELNSIIEREFIGSQNKIDNLDKLVEKLKKATQGTQEYRDIISQIYRQYDEYLPKVLSEKDAYNEVAAAALSAAEAIRAKAKASAFEEGQAAIEKKYGKAVGGATTHLLNSLKNIDPTITGELAEEFMQKFRLALNKEAGRDNVWLTFLRSFNSYFGENAFLELSKTYEPKAWAHIKASLESAATAFSDAYKKIDKAQEEFNSTINTRFGEAKFDSLKEREEVLAIEEDYRKAVKLADDSLKKQVLTQKAYNKQIKELDIKKLKDYIDYYKSVGRQDKVDYYQEMLNALKVPDDWMGKVQKIIEKNNLDKGSSFGLWADRETESTDYVEDMIKRYKELKEQIAYVSPFDKKQADRLKLNKKLIEEIARALNIDIAKLSAKKEESPEEKRLKRLISALRDLQTQYEKLKAVGASDESIKKLFEAEYPDLIAENGKEFVTDLEYLERGIKLANELKKINPEAGKKALVELGGDAISIYSKELEKQNKAYKEASKSAEEYFKTLRQWQAEDFNLEGEGIGFDISKIVSDLTTAINQIELKATKLKETFNQIIPTDFKEQIKQRIGEQIEIEGVVSLADKFGVEKPLLDALEKVDKNDISAIYKMLSENLGEDIAEDMIISSMPAINTIKADFTKEFGADAWTAFWRNFLTDGSKAIDRLAQKEKSYEKKKAQENLNDLAQKYVKENTSNLNMSDWSDKTLNQINIIQEALRNLLEGDVIIEGDTLTALQVLGLTTDDLIKKIKELLGGQYNDTVTEKIKKIQNIAKKSLSTFGTIGNSFEAIGEGFGAEALSDVGKYLSVAGEILDTIAECDAMWETIGDSAEIAADATSEVANSASGLASSLSWIEMVIKVVLIVVEQIANAVGRANAAQRQMIESALHYNEVMNEYASQKYDTIFGKNYFGGLINSAEEANTALTTLEDTYIKLLKGENTPTANYFNLKQLWWQLESMGKLSPDADLVDFVKALKANKEELLAARNISEGYKVGSNLAKDMDILIEALEKYEATLEDFKSRVRDLFGEMGNDIASNMIDAFLETENALGNLEKSFQSLGRSILESLLSSMIIDQILSKYEDRIAKMMLMYGAGETGPEMFSSLAEDMQKDFESYGDFWNNLISAWQDAGLLGAEEAGNTLADGIKGITEDTANLLASYLNAIRADVAYAKTLWERMDHNTQVIATALSGFSAPSLMEYQAQIAANTYNTALYTQEIMLGIRSVITAEGGLSAIRVLQY